MVTFTFSGLFIHAHHYGFCFASKNLELLCLDCMGLWVFKWLLECLWKVKAEGRKWCHYRGKGRSHFSYHSVSDCQLSPSSALPRLWIGSSEVFPAGQLQYRCWKVSVTSEEHGLDQKWWVTGDWSQLMREKMTPQWTGLVPKKESITLEKRLMEYIQQLCWPVDSSLHCSHRMRCFVVSSCDYLYLPLTSTFVSPKQSGCMICYFLFFIKF